MRILHIINSMEPSGAERHLANLLGPLSALGVENHLVTFFPGNGFEEQVRRYVRRAELAVGRVRAFPTAVRMARDVDVVHTQLVYADILGLTAAAAAGTPAVATLQNSVWAAENRAVVGLSPARYHMYRFANRMAARLALHFFAVSSKAARSYVDALGVPPERVEVISNSVDLQSFGPTLGPSREEARRAMGFKPGEFGVVSLARLTRQKGIDVSVRAVAMAARERPIHLAVAGEGAERSALARLIAETGAPVTLLGRRDALTAYRSADLFLLSSHFEGMPLALIEAMATGVPCLCSDIPENTETGADAVAYARSADPASFARELAALAGDPARRADLSRRGLERAAEFSAEAVAARFLAGVTRVLGR